MAEAGHDELTMESVDMDASVAHLCLRRIDAASYSYPHKMAITSIGGNKLITILLHDAVQVIPPWPHRAAAENHLARKIGRQDFLIREAMHGRDLL